MKKIIGIVLAAGSGTRMGKTKQLLPFGATTLLGRVVQAATASNLDGVIVVLGHEADKVRKQTDLAGTRIVVNPDYTDGQATSLCAGLGAVDGDCSGAMFLLADQPLIDHRIINTLIAAWQTTERSILVPYYRGTRGNPVIIGAPHFEDLRAITGDRGARVLFKQFPDLIEKIDIDEPAILTDVDTMEAYNRLLGQVG